MQRRIYRRTDGRINKKAMNKEQNRDQIIEILKYAVIGSESYSKRIEQTADAILALFENDCTCGGYPDCICDITRSAIKQKKNLKHEKTKQPEQPR